MNNCARSRKIWLAVLAVATLTMGATAGMAASRPAPGNDAKYETWLNKQVRHQLLMVPWYGVFDNLAYSVNGTQVTLSGQVLNYAIKDDAAAYVKQIEGVTRVIDNITVLPPSPFDNQTRRAEYRSIFSEPSLSRYAMGVNPSIHIIVDNGHVTLVGYVDSKMDKQLATMRANMVPGVFSVTNDLKVG